MANSDRKPSKTTDSSLLVPSTLSPANLLELYRTMILSRAVDERVWTLNRQGKAAIVASAQGHEAAQIGSVNAMDPNEDLFFTYYRDIAVLISLGMTPREVMLSFLAKDGEPMSGARQFPLHGAYPKLRVINLSNVVGTHIPQAVGAALAAKMRGDKTVVIVYFGDGASSVGDCHEAMNFAAIHVLPVIFFCENNGFAISVPRHMQMAVDSVASRSEGYGMPGVEIDGTNITAVHETTTEAVRRARSGDGPTLIDAKVERYLPHTSDDDDQRYRDIEQIQESRRHDPLKLLKSQLEEDGLLTTVIEEQFHADAQSIVNDATDFAEAAKYPGTAGFYDHVYANQHQGSGHGNKDSD